MRAEAKPDLTTVLGGLKDFQRRSVDYIIRRIYDDADRVDRFLLADEVGLGKTKVARGVIAHALHRLWDQVRRIDVVYVCSNATIARQNLNRLKLDDDDDFASATRLTLLPLHLRGLAERRVNFVSFTPATSFDLASGTGLRDERMLIHHLLSEGWGMHGAGPRNLLQGDVRPENWHRGITDLRGELGEAGNQIDPGLAERYLAALGAEDGLRARFEALCGEFGRIRARWPDDLRARRNALIGQLRRVLARVCIGELQPDLVILDEFQRFKSLLAGPDAPEEDREAAELAHDLFHHRDEQTRVRAKVLLLSATPYKMYTLAHEDEDHYTDFLATARFLLESPEEVRALEADLYRYRDALCGFVLRAEARALKGRIEGRLRRVMCRTERLAVGVDRNGLVAERLTHADDLRTADVAGYRALDGVVRSLDAGNAVELWKSAPYLLSVMDEHYKLKGHLRRAVKENDREVVAALSAARDTLLDHGAIERYEPLDGGNARMRALLNATVRNGAWKLLWLPPSLPYYALGGPWAEPGVHGFTKVLVFSAWHVVPKAISMVASYEAERLAMVATGEKVAYSELASRVRGLLRITEKDGKLGGLAALTLAYPCAALARFVDPLEAARSTRGASPPDAEVTISRARALVNEVLGKELRTAEAQGGPIDEDWYWAALVLLDAKLTPEVLEWLRRPPECLGWREATDDRMDEESLLGRAIERVRQFATAPTGLGRPPADLAEVVAAVALGSPAVTLLRALGRQWPNQATAPELLGAAAMGAMGFLRLYNRPEAVLVLRAVDAREPFWNRALDYGVTGNLQAVLDEYVHALRDNLGLTEAPAMKAFEIAAKVADAASLSAVRLSYDIFRFGEDGRVEADVRHVRGKYALRFGQGRDPSDDRDGQETRDDQVRDAFNSPFRPFVLASTSVGQEGLDFHLYCHAIYHWNLPSNPVDLEQREGRIHRFKGHAVRRNVASIRALGEAGVDPWAALFRAAAEGRTVESELVPYWVYPGEHRIERHVPLLPLSREERQLDDLRRSMALYRLVFGQPRQEDLLRVLAAEGGAHGDWSELQMNLAPTEASMGHDRKTS